MDRDIRLYFNESVEVEVAEQMKQHGIDAVTVRDLGLLGDMDSRVMNNA